ncbi:bifunctional nitric oxide dioxygenase/dihydropteridine reductase 2 [Legionella beliardensis]|uniref:Bifunctional nitric oxide dioxygenase/dihydropteridine reductase 2 n=1 Tax=Legionella beliardensis TaxID=91822 RepID=A0A378I0Y9_9GAMM|nr:NADPH oxidase family protein [Legionella beliardensis]STX28819.1 bifunctional nitric oxide dioxygenase/dihydropteridine reductase 2 [Legionella beliardensis]
MGENPRSFLSKAWSYGTYFIKNNKSQLIQTAGIVVASIGVFVAKIMEKFAEQEEPANAVAHAAGATIKYVLFPALTPYVMRLTTSVLQSSNIGYVLGLDKRFDTHKAVAGFISISSVIHTAGQLYHQPKVSTTQEGITGFILLGSVALPLGGAYFLAKSNYMKNKRLPYEFIFLRPHQVGAALFIATYALHTKDLRLLPYVLGVGGAFILDRLIEKLFFTFSTVTSHATAYGRIIELEIAKPPKFGKHLPGQYAYLSLIEEGKLYHTSHPFTIANGHQQNNLRFYIASSGKWTEALVSQVINNKFAVMQAKIAGPFGSPLQSQGKKTELVLISTGSGFTPFLALLSYHAQTKAPINVIAIHSSSIVNEFTPLIQAIYDAACNHVNIHESHFYLTSADPILKRDGMIQLKTSIEKLGMKFVDVDKFIPADYDDSFISGDTIESDVVDELSTSADLIHSDLVDEPDNSGSTIHSDPLEDAQEPVISNNEDTASRRVNDTVFNFFKNRHVVENEEAILEISERPEDIHIDILQAEVEVPEEISPLAEKVIFCHGRRFDPISNEDVFGLMIQSLMSLPFQIN